MKGLQSVAFVRTHLVLYMRQRPHSPLLVHGFPSILAPAPATPSFLGVLLSPAPAASVAIFLIFLIFFFLLDLLDLLLLAIGVLVLDLFLDREARSTG